MTIFGWPTIQFRIACALMGCSKDVRNLVVALGEEGNAKPWMQLCAVAAERTCLNVTTEKRKAPAGPGVGGVRSDILPKGCEGVSWMKYAERRTHPEKLVQLFFMDIWPVKRYPQNRIYVLQDECSMT